MIRSLVAIITLLILGSRAVQGTPEFIDTSCEMSEVASVLIGNFTADVVLESLSPIDERADIAIREPDFRFKSCVFRVATNITRSAMHRLDEACKNTRCPWMKKSCKEFLRHRELVKGYLIKKLRVHSHSAAFCAGVNYNVKSLTAFSDAEDFDTESLILSEEMDSADLYDLYAPEFDLWEVDEEIEDADYDDDGSDVLASNDFSDVSDVDGEEWRPRKKCRVCNCRVIRHIMGGILTRMKDFCENAKRPVPKRHCRWIRNHSERYYGMLLARVEPEKYAMGACIAMAQCRHGRSHE